MFHPIVITSNCLYIQLSLHQIVITSNCHYIKLSLHQIVITSNCHYINCVINFPFFQLANLTTCQFTTCQFDNLPFHQLAVLSTCHFIKPQKQYRVSRAKGESRAKLVKRVGAWGGRGSLARWPLYGKGCVDQVNQIFLSGWRNGKTM